MCKIKWRNKMRTKSIILGVFFLCLSQLSYAMSQPRTAYDNGPTTLTNNIPLDDSVERKQWKSFKIAIPYTNILGVKITVKHYSDSGTSTFVSTESSNFSIYDNKFYVTTGTNAESTRTYFVNPDENKTLYISVYGDYLNDEKSEIDFEITAEYQYQQINNIPKIEVGKILNGDFSKKTNGNKYYYELHPKGSVWPDEKLGLSITNEEKGTIQLFVKHPSFPERSDKQCSRTVNPSGNSKCFIYLEDEGSVPFHIELKGTGAGKFTLETFIKEDS